MKRKKVFIAIIFSCFIIYGCEGYKCVEATIFDSTTKRAIDSVKCKVVTAGKTVYSDTTGKIDVCNKVGGCMFGCRDIVIRLSKDGYKPLEHTNLQDSVIYMEKY